MTHDQFKSEVERLKKRFGERAFDDEFVALLWREVHDLSAQAFTRCCEVLMETRPHHRAPLMPDFREFAVAERNRSFKSESRQAAQALKVAPQEMRQHLRVILNRDFGGESAWEAAQKALAKDHEHDPDPDGAA